MSDTLLQIFLFVNIFVIGGLAVIALQHAYAHFRPREHDRDAHPAPPQARLPKNTRKRLIEVAERQFQISLSRSMAELERELKQTAAGLNRELGRVGADIVTNEMKQYRASLDKLRTQLDSAVDKNQTELLARQAELAASIEKQQAELDAQIATRRTELETKLTEDINLEQDRLIAQIDTKLADAVASFLTETMQHNVDLGAQGPYLMNLLEEHKADLRREVKDET